MQNLNGKLLLFGRQLYCVEREQTPGRIVTEKRADSDTVHFKSIRPKLFRQNNTKYKLENAM